MQNMEVFTKDDDIISRYNVNIQNVSLCKKIRNLGKLDRIKLDESEHRSGLNKHLLQYLEYCGVTPLDYIKDYLSNLQPYMIERRQDQEKFPGAICILDNVYRVSLYIKVNSSQFEEVIVSFHENNHNGIAKTNSLIRPKQLEYAFIFADRITAYYEGTNTYSVHAIMQRGLKKLPVNVSGKKYKDGFIVLRSDVERVFLDYCNEYIRDLYTSDLQIDFSKVEVFSMLQQISYTSYGSDTFSSISLLIDSLTIQNDTISRSTADFALCTFVQNLQLTDEQRANLLQLLEEKFRVTSIKQIDSILERVRDNLYRIE